MHESCGTLRGRQRHRRRHEDPCDSCLAAWSVYVQEQRRPSRRSAQGQLMERARRRAQRELARNHPDEFRRLMYREIDRERSEAADRLRRAATLLEA